MPADTVYSGPFMRGFFVEALIQHYKIDVAVKDIKEPIVAANFPLGKVPSLIGPKGLKLTEVIAVMFYLIAKLPEAEQAKLLGAKEQFPELMKWLSFSNSELIGSLSGAFKPLQGRVPYNKKVVDENLATAELVAASFEQRLVNYTFLVGERMTIADVYAAFAMSRGFATVWGKEWRSKHPEIMRWFNTITASPIFKESKYAQTFELIEKPIEFVPPKKEKKQKQQQAPKKEAKKEEKPAEEEKPVEKKAKHPLELLGKSTIPLNDWKVKYSNEDTREKALPWFWNEFYNPAEWSLWKVEYKYNDELTMTFMSNNLIGGFFNRLTGSIKYIFGSMVVYGENNNNGIVGAFLVRGQDCAPAFEVAPDHESYNFTKLDATKEEDRAFINNSWAWDEPMIVNGEKREIADGKVCK
ncbi:translation elongation factor EF1B gamma [Saccharomycopsis crataegensis]|uniref:Translation elongation factor EF1B gamma n=1 Tax=Saccharomycopsis crataegensis TaxID=43959 RepID=A0AAV5QKR2_9ASCO|nr:translation elongation factor EF1B gamma [Saccharomycopsis crataegensis]